jgi:NadR type nicotinamide-nucleotide adenylyltransferase
MAQGAGAAGMKRVCLHGPESTGKSTLATRLAAHFGCEVVPEYGRAYCEAHGTDIGMAELVHIAEAQDAMNKAAAVRAAELHAPLVLFDTDPLITEVWAQMMFGHSDPWFERFTGYADLYLLLDIDLPFIDDGLRVYAKAEERRHFFELCKVELDNRGVRYALIQGEGESRFRAALEAIEAAC